MCRCKASTVATAACGGMLSHRLPVLSKREERGVALSFLHGYRAVDIGRTPGLTPSNVRVLQRRAFSREAMRPWDLATPGSTAQRRRALRSGKDRRTMSNEHTSAGGERDKALPSVEQVARLDAFLDQLVADRQPAPHTV